MSVRQTGLRQWSEDGPEERITGIDISAMAGAALEESQPVPFDGETAAEEIRAATFRTTEYAIRRTAPNTPDRPEDPTAFDPILDGRLEETPTDSTRQTHLAVATDGGTAKGDN